MGIPKGYYYGRLNKGKQNQLTSNHQNPTNYGTTPLTQPQFNKLVNHVNSIIVGYNNNKHHTTQEGVIYNLTNQQLNTVKSTMYKYLHGVSTGFNHPKHGKTPYIIVK